MFCFCYWSQLLGKSLKTNALSLGGSMHALAKKKTKQTCQQSCLKIKIQYLNGEI